MLDLAQPLPETQCGIGQSQHFSQLDVLQEWWLSLFELDVAQPLPETQSVIGTGIGRPHHNYQLDVLQEGQKLLFDIEIAQHPHGTVCVIVQAHLSNKIVDNLILVVHSTRNVNFEIPIHCG